MLYDLLQVAAVAAQLLRTLSDPTASHTTSTTAATSAWDNSLGGAGEAVMHTAGALSVSGMYSTITYIVVVGYSPFIVTCSASDMFLL